MKKILVVLISYSLIISSAYAGLISHTDYISGGVISSAGQNSNENTIFNEFNGNINSANVATGGLIGTNLANGTITATQLGSGSATLSKLDTTGSYGQTLVSTNTGTAPYWGGTALLQVVSSTNSNVFSISANTYQNTHLFGNIVVASTNSRIEITITGVGQSGSATNGIYLSIYRGNTQLTDAPVSYCFSGGGSIDCTMSVNTVDSPLMVGTTSYFAVIKGDTAASNSQFPVTGTLATMVLKEYAK